MTLENILTSIVAFVSTNIDDIFVLMLFYASGKFSKPTIVVGQYLGIGALVLISIVGAYIGSFFDERYVGLLGLFPIYLAIRQVIALFRGQADNDDDGALKSPGILAIAGVTVANGGDNIGVYVPLLAAMSPIEKIQLVIVFTIATYLWCRTAQYLVSHPLVAKQLEKYGHILTPIVLFLLGLLILIESRTLSLVIS